MTIYQQELLRALPRLECAGRIDETDETLYVTYQKEALCWQDQQGFLSYNGNFNSPDREKKLDALKEAAAFIREYAGLYESSPPMEIEGIREYRKLAEYGDTILGGMYTEEYGFMFSTWKTNAARSYADWGDYSPDYAYAKKSFAIRSGLMNENLLFSPQEAAVLYAAVEYTRNNCETLSFEQEKRFNNLTEKLSRGYPDLEATLPSIEQSDPTEYMRIGGM